MPQDREAAVEANVGSKVLYRAKPDARAGVDLGMRVLATIADTDGNVAEVQDPAPLRATLDERRRIARQLSWRIPDRVDMSEREPSSLDWTDGACTCAGSPSTSLRGSWWTLMAR